MKEAFVKNNIEVVEQYPIRSKYGYIADFAIPSKKIIIECDGEVWHKLGNSHDRKRDGFLKRLGWKVIRFRGQEIKNNAQLCVEKI